MFSLYKDNNFLGSQFLSFTNDDKCNDNVLMKNNKRKYLVLNMYQVLYKHFIYVKEFNTSSNSMR